MNGMQFRPMLLRIRKWQFSSSPLRTFDKILDFETYEPAELERIFRHIAVHDESPSFSRADLRQYLAHRVTVLDDTNNKQDETGIQARETYLDTESKRIFDLLSAQADTSQNITQDEFTNTVRGMAEQIDWRRAVPIYSSLFLVGASVGVVTPAMPFVVQDLGLTVAEYGHIVSAFGVAKLLGNVPSATAVEIIGRKPFMTYSMAALAVGVGGIGLASSFQELYGLRCLTGLGVAALSAAGTLMVTDLSTNLNRAQTMAPVMSAFAAGTTLGPALGGYLVDQVGLATTFGIVGCSYLGVGLLNRFLLTETQRRPLVFPWQSPPTPPSIAENVRDSLAQWGPLFANREIRNVLILNALYWTAYSGAQMTILPLFLTQDLSWSATAVGHLYMGLSTIQIISNPVFGNLSDRVGRVPMMIGGTALMGSAICLVPETWYALGLWSMGSSMLSTAPIAFISDRVAAQSRAQGIAMLRTFGDVGLLIGATAAGAVADATGSLAISFQSTSGLLLATSAWFAVRTYGSGQFLVSTTAEEEQKKD